MGGVARFLHDAKMSVHDRRPEVNFERTYASICNSGSDGFAARADGDRLAAVGRWVVGSAESDDVVTVAVNSSARTSNAVLGVVSWKEDFCVSIAMKEFGVKLDDHPLAVPEVRRSRGAATAREEMRERTERSLNILKR